MRLERHVVTRKNQHLVALPSELREHLGLVGGSKVYWHIGRKGMVSLTVTGRVRAGRPTKDEECPSCSKYRAEVDRLRRELRDGEAGTSGGFFRQGYMQAVAHHGKLDARMDVALTLLKELAAAARRRPSSGSPPSRPRPRRDRRRATETVPAELLNLPPGVVAVDIPDPG